MRISRKTVPPAPKSISVRLRPEMMRGLIAHAEKKGTTQSAILQIALAEYLERNGR